MRVGGRSIGGGKSMLSMPSAIRDGNGRADWGANKSWSSSKMGSLIAPQMKEVRLELSFGSKSEGGA